MHSAVAHGDPLEAQFRARMAELGRKGGKIGGKRRLETLSKARRRAITSLRTSPAMAAGITDRLFEVSELVDLLVESESKKAA